MIIKKKIQPKGQSLIETIFALGIMSFGMFGVLALTFYNFNTAGLTQSKVIAVNLAREGVEVVRNIRDTNRLQIPDGLGSVRTGQLQGGAERSQARVLYDAINSKWNVEFVSGPESRFQLWRDRTNGMYNHDASATGTLSPFSRKITITDVACFAVNAGVYQVSASPPACQFNALTGQGAAGIRVVSTVTWRDYMGQTQQVQAVEQLYDW